MLRIDERLVRARPETCFLVAADVERWPALLPHYRRVRFLRREAFGHGRVEMAAWRHFGPVAWPTWWVSEMAAEPGEPAVYYRHVAGITKGMAVRWQFLPHDDGCRVRIVHEWDGPRWPLVGRFAARHVIGPRFVSAIARRTLAGVGAEAVRREREPDRPRDPWDRAHLDQTDELA